MELPDIVILREFRITGTDWDSSGTNELILPTGTAPKLTMDGCGRLIHRVFGVYAAANTFNGTVTPKFYSGAGLELTHTAVAVNGSGAGANGFLEWELQIIPLAQSDGTFAQWAHSVLKVLPDSAGSITTSDLWFPTTINFSADTDLHASVTLSSANHSLKVAQITAVISPARISWL